MFTFDDLKSHISDFTYEPIDINGTPCALIDTKYLLQTATVLKEKFGFTHFIDTVGVDRWERKMRFEVTHNIRNPETKERIFLKIRCDERDPHIPSVARIWSGANWSEREAYDMFGIIFDGHPDLRRMFMPDEFEHYPLRKDFPLTGIPGSIPLPNPEALPTSLPKN
jgi:NADH-quinone oxidoreductase subunit C